MESRGGDVERSRQSRDEVFSGVHRVGGVETVFSAEAVFSEKSVANALWKMSLELSRSST